MKKLTKEEAKAMHAKIAMNAKVGLAHGVPRVLVLSFAACLPLSALLIGFINLLVISPLKSNFEPLAEFSSFSDYWRRTQLSARCESRVDGRGYLDVNGDNQIRRSDSCFLFRKSDEDRPILLFEVRSETNDNFCLIARIAVLHDSNWRVLPWSSSYDDDLSQVSCVSGWGWLGFRSVKHRNHPSVVIQQLKNNYDQAIDIASERIKDNGGELKQEHIEGWATTNEVAEVVVPFLEKAFVENYSRVHKGYAVAITRIVNGIFPIGILGVTLLITIIVKARRKLFVDTARQTFNSWPTDTIDRWKERNIQEETAKLKTDSESFLRQNGFESKSIDVRMRVIESIGSANRNDLESKVQSLVSDVGHTRAENAGPLKRLVPLLTRLGMIGTVVALPMVFGGAVDVFADAENGPDLGAMIKLLLELSFAFDTTFLGLLLSTVAGFFVDSELDEEKKLWEEIERYCRERYVR